MINADFINRPKQYDYFLKSLAAAQHKNDYKILCYGGAVRGGKTFGTLLILLRLCSIFPNSRWHVIREDFPKLEKTSIPSFEKIVAGSKNWSVSRKTGNYHFTHKNGSKIFFVSENIKIDPNLDWMLGLETNGILLEQVEELSEKTFNMALSRTGSWYLPKMPRGLIFMTFNPTQTWVKKRVYDKWANGTLPLEYHFQPALPTDNPSVTQDQYAGWQMMPERYIKQFIEGDWTDFDGESDRWLFAFSEKNHTGKVDWNENEPTYLSFDFNRNPITVSVWQHYGGIIRGVRAIKIHDATIYSLCAEIEKHFPNAYFFVTGDASGDVKTTMSSLSNFGVIKNYFKLSETQMQVSRANPRLEDSRMLCNSIFEKYPIILDKDNFKDCISDYKNCKAKADNTILKDNRNKAGQQADMLDNTRYYIHRYFANFMKFFAQS